MQLEEGASKEGREHKPQARTLRLLSQGAVGRAAAVAAPACGNVSVT